jgi:ribosomal protein S18 acetylase RimI-like enzyme
MDAMPLRKAIQADAATLGALHVASWRETYTGIIPDEMLAAQSVDARTAMWNKILGSPDEFGCTAVLVAEDGGHVVGFGSCGKQRDKALTDAGFSGEFSAIYVLRSYQGRGVGRSIMAAMSRELSNAGHTTACLWVLRENDPARAFYDKLGGVIVGEKLDERPNATLVEDAYGWRDLSSLIS